MWAVAQPAEVYLIRGALRMGSSGRDIRSGAGDAGDAGDVLPGQRLIGPVFPLLTILSPATPAKGLKYN